MSDKEKIDLQVEKEKKIKDMLENYNTHKKKYQIITLTIFILSLALLGLFLLCMPSLSQEEKDLLFQMPNTPQKMKECGSVLRKYSSENFWLVLFLYMYLYLFFQAFSIPGHGFLAIISGSIWPITLSIPVTCISATLGSTISYLLSSVIIKGCIINTWPSKVQSFVGKVIENRDRLFFYMLFMRFTPLIPNTMVNLISPIAGIPLHIFMIGTFFGLMPVVFIHVEMGTTLEDISQFGVNPMHVLTLIGLSLAALAPTYLFKKKKEKKLN